MNKYVCQKCNGLVDLDQVCPCEPPREMTEEVAEMLEALKRSGRGGCYPEPAPTKAPPQLRLVSANPKAQHGAQKPSLGLIPPVALAHCAMAMEHGAAKYGAYNWRENPVEVMTYVHAGLRHLLDYLDGAELTEDGGGLVHNLGAVMACCAIVLDCMEQGELIDNRPRPGASQSVNMRLKAAKLAKET